MASLVIEAVYENGVLRPSQPLPFRESAKVRLTVDPTEIVAATYGLVGWKGDARTVEIIALSHDLDELDAAEEGELEPVEGDQP